MPLEIQKGRSKWWYGRVIVSGRKISRNLGVEIRGEIPANLEDTGDQAFELSRSRAQAALTKLQLDLKKRRSAEELVQTIHEIRTGSRIKSISLADMATSWVALPRRRKLSESYKAQGVSLLGRFSTFVVNRHPSAKEMADVQAETAQAFLAAESTRGVSPKTYNSTLIFLRSCFGALRRAAGLAENPFDGIPTREEETVFRKPFNPEELEDIIRAAKKFPFIYPIIVTAVCTALRRGDCCMLLKTAVDLPGRFIRVKTSKTGGEVQIPIFPLLHEVLVGLPKDNSPYVFPVHANKYQLNPDYITDQVRRVLKTAGFFDSDAAAEESTQKRSRGQVHEDRPTGLRKASVRDFHSFRVTWVTLALTAGVPLEIVQKVTGHRTAAIVMKHYFQPGREDFRRTLEQKLPAIIGGGKATAAAEKPSVKNRLAEMTADNWSQIRDELMRSFESGPTAVVSASVAELQATG